MVLKSTILDEAAMRRALVRIAHEILERNRGANDLALVGIHRRGGPIAAMLAENIARIEGVQVPVGSLDITGWRDDVTRDDAAPQAAAADLPFCVTGKRVILVDDVIYTGRTVRAAIEGLFAAGRPAVVQLAVVVDRGHRELPIRADYVGKNLPTSTRELVAVNLPEYDGRMSVELYAIEA